MIATLGVALWLAVVRIISLAPSLTEDLYAIGAGPQMVGADTYSDRPAAAKALPRVGAMLGVSAEKIISLEPTLVVGLPYQAPVIAQLRREGIEAEALGGDSLADDFATIRRIGALSGHARAATILLEHLRRRISALEKIAANMPRVGAFAVVGISPIYTSGRASYINDLLRYARLRPVTDGIVQPWFMYSAEQLELTQPQILITVSSDSLPQAPPWSLLQAVIEGCIISVADDDLLRPGPYLVDALERIVKERRALPATCNVMRR